MMKYLVRKLNNKRGQRGSITVFLACILLPMIMAEASIFNLSALIAAKHASIDAGKLASNSALTAYDHELHDKYGLIAFNTSRVDGIVNQVFEQNLNMYCYDSYGCSDKGYGYVGAPGHLGTSYQYHGETRTASVSTSYMGSLSNKEILKGQICDAMWGNYQASAKLESAQLDDFLYYHDSLIVISKKQNYDKELLNLYGDLQDILDEVYPYSSSEYIHPSEKSEEDESEEVSEDVVEDEKTSELANKIIEYCDNALARKNTLQLKANDWNTAMNSYELPDSLYSNLSKYYNIETDLDEYFDSIQNLKTAMYYYAGNDEYYSYVTAGYTSPYTDEITIDDFICNSSYIDKLENIAISRKTIGPTNTSDEVWKSEYNSQIMVNKGAQNYLTMSSSAYVSDEDNGNYKAIAPDDMGYEESKDKYTDVFVAQDSQMQLMLDTTEKYSVIPECKAAISGDSSRYMISEYATEYFSSYRRTDDYSLTGGRFRSFGTGHTPYFSDVEYIIYGLQSARDNCEQFKSQMFYTQYAGHLIDYFAETTPSSYGNGKPGGSGTSLEYLNMYFKNDLEALVDSQDSASSDIDNMYSNWSDVRVGLSSNGTNYRYTYAHYMKLFMLMSVVNSEDTVLERIKYVVNTNMATVESGFDLDKAYTAVTIQAKVNVKGVMGNGTSFDYNTFAMY